MGENPARNKENPAGMRQIPAKTAKKPADIQIITIYNQK
jgi:hypothetical protein